jgi:hypothetical protein
MAGLRRRPLLGRDLDALGLDQAQGEHRLADQHRQRLTSAGAAAQQLHRLTGEKAELAEPAQGDGIDLRRRRDHARHRRPAAGGERGERLRCCRRPGKACGGHGRRRDGIANRNNYQS